jgi:hypothetical protein|tara:strand:- start:485 stop:748 length:264 start_codon:yes stop_codon:yes gene_type:complete
MQKFNYIVVSPLAPRAGAEGVFVFLNHTSMEVNMEKKPELKTCPQCGEIVPLSSMYPVKGRLVCTACDEAEADYLADDLSGWGEDYE